MSSYGPGHCCKTRKGEMKTKSRCYRKFDRSEISSQRSYFLGNFTAEHYFFLGNTIAARKFDRSRKLVVQGPIAFQNIIIFS